MEALSRFRLRSPWTRCTTIGLLFVLLEVGLQALPPPTPTPTPRPELLYVRPGRTFNPAAAGAAGGVVVANLEGRVTDESGSPLPGVQYVLTGPNLTAERTGVTDATGRYRISALRPGTYTIRFRLPGFSERQSALSLSPGQVGTVNMVMGAGPPPTPPPTPPPPPPTVDLGPGPTPTRPPETVDPGDQPPIRQVHWNSWIQKDQGGPAIARIEVGSNYIFDFDLAAFDYSAIADFPGTASFPVDRTLYEELDRYPGATAEFYVKPLLGGGLVFRPTQSELRKVDIDLTRLRKPPTGWSRDEPLPVLSGKLRAAQVQIGVRAQSEGCATVGLSIWNATLDRPIDHIVRDVRVVRVGGDPTAPPCGPADQSKALRGSLISLLAIAPDQPADAALHVFEMSSTEPTSHAVFKVRDGPLLTWRLNRRLSQYVTGNQFVGRLLESRSRHDYGLVGGTLTSVLFPATSTDATSAKQYLTDLANRSNEPLIFARLVDPAGTNMFLPLGLLRLNSGALLGERVTVTQPLLKSETYSAGSRCVGGWTMVLPENLGTAVESDFLRPVRAIPNRISRWTDFVSYVGSQPTDSSKGEGLLLLAHHAGGELWFVRPQSMMSEDIARRYPPGSVAVLSACALGDLSRPTEIPLLKILNGLGIEAAIVSPFEIEGTVGARFAFQFANEIQKARDQREDIDLVSLFRRTKTAFRGDRSVENERDAVYEFVLAGNGGLRLCP